MSGALDGLRVLDLSQMLAGPYVTMILADLGADVVKVEPLTGDATRVQGPRLDDDELQAFGGYFQSVNRGKRSIAVDLRTDAGREVVLRLAREADVLVENFRVGVMDRLGLSYEVLHEQNPRLVYAAIRGFGDPRTGPSPYGDWPAFDIVAQAMGGFMGITGPDPAHPTKSGPGVGDLFPAAMATIGLLAALHHARESGEGQFVDVAMYDAMLALCERIVYLQSYSGIVSQPQGNSHPLLCPFDLFPTNDGHITIAAPFEHQWQRLCEIIGRPELADDPRFATNNDRVAHAEECRAILSDWTSQRTKQDVIKLLGGSVPAGPVQNAADIAADPHIAARNMIITLDHPGSAQTVQVAGTPIKMTATQAPDPIRAPLLAEHTDEVLKTVGYDDEAIAELRAQGVLRPVPPDALDAAAERSVQAATGYPATSRKQ